MSPNEVIKKIRSQIKENESLLKKLANKEKPVDKPKKA